MGKCDLDYGLTKRLSVLEYNHGRVGQVVCLADCKSVPYGIAGSIPVPPTCGHGWEMVVPHWQYTSSTLVCLVDSTSTLPTMYDRV